MFCTSAHAQAVFGMALIGADLLSKYSHAWPSQAYSNSMGRLQGPEALNGLERKNFV